MQQDFQAELEVLGASTLGALCAQGHSLVRGGDGEGWHCRLQHCVTYKLWLTCLCLNTRMNLALNTTYMHKTFLPGHGETILVDGKYQIAFLFI